MNPRKSLILPILMIVVGAGWLLTTLGVFPGVDWAWSLGLAAAGTLVLVVGGLDKATVVVGPFLWVASALSVFRQLGHLSDEVEGPCLLIVAGVLALIARHPAIRIPGWYLGEGDATRERDDGAAGKATDSQKNSETSISAGL